MANKADIILLSGFITAVKHFTENTRIILKQALANSRAITFNSCIDRYFMRVLFFREETLSSIGVLSLLSNKFRHA